MAKKVRKPRSASPRTYGQSGPQTAAPAPAEPAPRPVTKAVTATAAPPAPRASKQVDLRAEYPYVGPDLKRLGATAAVMFTVLVVLNLVLNFLS